MRAWRNQGADGSEYVNERLGDEILAAELSQNRTLAGAHSQAIEVLRYRKRQPSHLRECPPMLRVGVDAQCDPLTSCVEVITVAQIPVRGIVQ